MLRLTKGAFSRDTQQDLIDFEENLRENLGVPIDGIITTEKDDIHEITFKAQTIKRAIRECEYRLNCLHLKPNRLQCLPVASP